MSTHNSKFNVPIDLLILPFSDFDEILGMDWLTEHGVILDCRKKKFLIQDEIGKLMEVSGFKSSGSTQMISSIQAEKFLKQGSEAFLAYVINTKTGNGEISNIRTVCEFPDVFPNELPG